MRSSMDLGPAQQKQSDPRLMCSSMPAASNNALGQRGPPSMSLRMNLHVVHWELDVRRIR